MAFFLAMVTKPSREERLFLMTSSLAAGTLSERRSNLRRAREGGGRTYGAREGPCRSGGPTYGVREVSGTAILRLALTNGLRTAHPVKLREH
jgi:hypothetical protein